MLNIDPMSSLCIYPASLSHLLSSLISQSLSLNSLAPYFSFELFLYQFITYSIVDRQYIALKDYSHWEMCVLGAGPVMEMQDSDTRKVYDNLFQPTKRHIGALARLGWLPTLRATRFSRSPRYLVSRSDH